MKTKPKKSTEPRNHEALRKSAESSPKAEHTSKESTKKSGPRKRAKHEPGHTRIPENVPNRVQRALHLSNKERLKHGTKNKDGIFQDKKKGVILVSGSAGRIGAALVKALGDDYHIVGFELMSVLYASAQEELVPVDVSSPKSVAQAF